MAQVYPFRALRFSISRIPVDKVVTQPYDKISKEMQDSYYASHPNNIVRIVLGKADAGDSPQNNVYTRAAATMEEWRSDGVLENLDAPAFFVYFQRFTIPGTTDVQIRKGFIGIGRLENYADKVVFPHEKTLTGPKKDRLELLRHTRTHFEQIFMLYEDPDRRIDSVLDNAAMNEPDIDVLDEYGVEHKVWTLSDPEVAEIIKGSMEDKKLVIADGHHRYETALAYRDEMREKAGGIDPDEPYEFMAMTFFNMDSPALTILPTHRVLAGVADLDMKGFLDKVSKFFDAAAVSGDAESIRAALVKGGRERVSIGLFADGGQTSLLLGLKPDLDLAAVMPDLSERQRMLDVVVLHRLLIEKCLGITEEAVKKESHIIYMREMIPALDAVKSGRAQLAFLLNPTDLHQMRDVAYEGNVMPQKSTDFYPKVLSGLVMYRLL